MTSVPLFGFKSKWPVVSQGLISSAQTQGHEAAEIATWTDAYFNRTQRIVGRAGEVDVTYAFFIRRPVLAAPGPMLALLDRAMSALKITLSVDLPYQEGDWIGAGEPILYITGPFSALAPLETLLLQKLGCCCVVAHNALVMARALPKTAFLAMDARHCTGQDMQELVAYGAAVGSAVAQKEGAIGFVNSANTATAHFFGQKVGAGTMPHALIGYAGSTSRAAALYHDTYPHEAITVLVDYFAREVTDATALCKDFSELAHAGRMSVRLDTHGGRFLEGLDTQSSYAILEKYAPKVTQRNLSESQRRHLVGSGVSAAAIWRMREALDASGGSKVKIVASSGFDVEKCQMMAAAQAPVDVIGTGSHLPLRWNETYATADIIAYNGEPRVKAGREYLIKSWKNDQKKRQL